MTTDTSERGLERLICAALTGSPCEPGAASGGTVREPRPEYGGSGWVCGDPDDYDREHCVDSAQLAAFLRATQSEAAETFDLGADSPARRKLLARLEKEIARRGVVDVLRHGVKHGPRHVDLFYGSPSPGNPAAAERYAANRFSVTRQLRYSAAEPLRALDVGLFVNGLPVVTFELKNSLTKQTVDDAVQQYRRDRDPHERLFALGRCAVHFAVDEHEVRFCTHLQGKGSWFLPFNRGWNDGAGNPPNAGGLKTDYLWRRILTPDGLTEILEHYAQIVETRDERTRRKTRRQIWPRHHQLDVVRRLLADVAAHGAGRRYLVQHSAGSGKSNSIAWLAHRLIDVERNGARVFDSIVVVTDRRILDRQIRDTIRQYAQVGATVGHAARSGDLRRFLSEGKRIIVSTVQKFPIILDDIGNEHRRRRFAIVIDEAHSSQGGRTSASMSAALGAAGASDGDDTLEDRLNRIMESRKLLPNASYFAFTATPKNRTLEIFGAPQPQPDGAVRHRPFHSYTMKQAIEEGFIVDVLAHHTPVASYYRLVKTVAGDPRFDVRRAGKKLRRYVEGHEHAVRLKAEIIVDHFHDRVAGPRKVGGEARAMVVTGRVERAIRCFHAVRDYLTERRSPFRALVAFSGEHEHGGAQVTEATLNGFPSNLIAERIREDPYRLLICADKFQTGYDEPLLHTMYVDKVLSGVQAVQTLSRLNRAHPKKRDAFVLDFVNDADTIRDAFADYYRTTLLADETDPDRLHDLKAALDGRQVYSREQVDRIVALYLDGADRGRLDPILDACVAVYVDELDADGQIDFKSKATAFLRNYGFLATVLRYTNAEWEKLSILLDFLVPRLPSPPDDAPAGILQAIDMDSYRAEKQAAMQLRLPDEDAEIGPTPAAGGGRQPEPELDLLSNIVKAFNERFGNVPWADADRVRRLITVEIPSRVADDAAYRNARRRPDRQNARIEHDKALRRVMTAVLKDDTELFRQFSDNDDFRRWLAETVFALTYEAAS